MSPKDNSNRLLHPGGSLKPSPADIETTKRLSKALTTINAKLIDHIIVAESSYFSFAEKCLI